MESIKEESECCVCSSKENLRSMLEPYNFEENIGIYSTMIAECFQIELKPNIQEYIKNLYLICKDCVSCLRQAIMFRSRIEIAYDRLQDLYERFKKDGRVDISTEHSNIVETKDNIILNPDTSDLPNYCEMNNDGHVPIECSDIMETKENIIKLDISERDSMDIDLAASSSNENALKLKTLKIVIEKLDINKLRDITINSTKEHFQILKDTTRGSDMKSQHSDIIHCNFKCHICNRTFVSNSDLQKHLLFMHKSFQAKSSIHSDLKSHKCQVCDKVFSERQYLLRHMKLHSNPQKYTCKYCNKILSRSSALLNHEKIHQNIKDFICDYCNKEFRARNDLARHIQTHSYEKPSHKCELCEKVFMLRGTLLRHMKLHSNPQKYTCKHCNKIFTRTLNLRLHEKVHMDRFNLQIL